MPPNVSPTSSMAATQTPPSPPENPVEPKLDRPRSRYESHDPHELVTLIEDLEGERLSARVREAIWVSLILHLVIFWYIFYGPKLKMFQRAQVVNPAEVVPQKAPERVFLNTPPDLIKPQKPKSSNVISDKDRVAQTKHPTLDQKTIQELEAMRRAGRPSPPPQPRPQQQARAVQPAPRPAAPKAAPARQQSNQESALNAPTPRPQPAQQPSQTKPNPATAQPNMSVGDMIRQAERAAAANGQMGDNGENAPLEHPGMQSGLEVLSDTMGVDFGPYLRQIVRATQNSWDLLIPEAARPPLYKKGRVAIQFIINPDGSVKQMQLIGPSGDVSLDRAAWGGITGASPFPPLPKKFKGPYLALRFYFLYNEQTPANGGR